MKTRFALILALILAAPVYADEKPAASGEEKSTASVEEEFDKMPPPESEAPWDKENAEDVNQTCAACHGKLGEGGKEGEYPLLSGQLRDYLDRQLRFFKNRHRINIPMFPYTQERELSEKDLNDIAGYLSHQRFAIDVTPVRGDIKAGEEDYQSECAHCHGKGGEGKPRQPGKKKYGPALAGQYPTYLFRQLAKFTNGERHSESMEESLDGVSKERLNNIIAYLATLERFPGLAEEQARATQQRIQDILKGLGGTP